MLYVAASWTDPGGGLIERVYVYKTTWGVDLVAYGESTVPAVAQTINLAEQNASGLTGSVYMNTIEIGIMTISCNPL